MDFTSFRNVLRDRTVAGFAVGVAVTAATTVVVPLWAVQASVAITGIAVAAAFLHKAAEKPAGPSSEPIEAECVDSARREGETAEAR